LFTYWKTYASYFDNITENVDRYLTQIISIQAFLEKHKIKYLMIDSMGESPEFYEYINSNRKVLLAQIDRKRYPQIKSFSEWSAAMGFPPTPCHHANEDAHAAWADHLLKYIEQEKLMEQQ
jgi:hypothetical protein